MHPLQNYLEWFFKKGSIAENDFPDIFICASGIDDGFDISVAPWGIDLNLTESPNIVVLGDWHL